MLTPTEAYLQRIAKHFPAEEIWVHQDDIRFWAFSVSNGAVISTSGRYENGVLEKQTESFPESSLEEILERKENEGYHCFSMML